MVKMIEYIKESFDELKNNVSWPSWSQGQSLTVLVALFSIIFSLAIWGVDTVFARVVETFFNWIK
ncbi:MAG: preprotein translocase subunit SecE [Flavobacteriaceae bacterium]|nr:preprotein translocase subunit SecE [Flavobacteriaceae bacterium]